MPDAEALAALRHRRWRYDRAQIKTFARIAAWIDDVGFALLWPAAGVDLPALWVVGGTGEPHEGAGWGPDAERMWGWKDELPRKGRAWYGPFLYGRKSFLAPDLLALLYPRAGEPGDFADADLSPDARRVAEVLLAGGSTSLAVLREATGLTGKRNNAVFTRAVRELGRALVVTHHGVSDEGGGWPSAVLDLTARVFDVPARGARDERRVRATQRFMDTMIQIDPRALSRAFNWMIQEARESIETAGERAPSGAAARRGTRTNPSRA
jgi:hypothetical protein